MQVTQEKWQLVDKTGHNNNIREHEANTLKKSWFIHKYSLINNYLYFQS